MSVIVRHVTKRYGAQKALDDVSIEVRPGGVFGLLGPNGAGKSTLMRIITGYLEPDSGQVEVCGIDVAKDIVNVRRLIGYLPENNPLYYDMYVREYLEFRAGVFGLRHKRQRIREVLEATGLTPEAHKKAGALSKGYKQRLGLAAALLHDPQVLILDEPTSGLDPNQVQDIRRLIVELGQSRIVIMSSHIMQEVEAVCSHAAIIAKGRIRADEPLDQLRRRGQGNVLTLRLERETSPEDLSRLEGVLSVKRTADGAWELRVMDPEGVRKNVFDWAVKNQNPILEFRTRQATMEDVFQLLTRDESEGLRSQDYSSLES
ncbi:MAG: ATP-binding cassette domain-containing protein [Flavobacteriales bacterium]|nr:ATP-binding cassette domain-containing protein [Flavobacteriales bacterium]MCX7767673.1 ATP-binding cassette domain-containing protein [Flavobacteriales bacterium]MDW8410608.1 ATP-binding cassette domain-containing protein [Flavobacteriales bacterium]